MTDPLFAHLLDIASDPASAGLILAGGFGIRLKQASLRESGTRTLIENFPMARATQDLDFFLTLSLFVQKEQGRAVRALLDRLGYDEHNKHYQFGKPFDPLNPEIKVKVDLLARTPRSDEGILVKPPRVGSGAGIDLHGRETPEGFAVEEHCVRLPLQGVRSDGVAVETGILVPHAYAWLNMKVRAAHDWLRRQRGEMNPKANSEKHVFDVYVLTAMLTETELTEASNLSGLYLADPGAQEICDYAQELYGTEDSPGVREVKGQAHENIDYPIFWEALNEALGIK